VVSSEHLLITYQRTSWLEQVVVGVVALVVVVPKVLPSWRAIRRRRRRLRDPSCRTSDLWRPFEAIGLIFSILKGEIHSDRHCFSCRLSRFPLSIVHCGRKPDVSITHTQFAASPGLAS
jgi:hypothetical protein